MMKSQDYARLNPLAAAVAAGVTALLGFLLVGLPMTGMMAGYAGAGWMMGGGGYGYHAGSGFLWLGGVLAAALAGAVFAWIYNAVVEGTKARRSGPDPASRIQPTG